MRKVFLKIFLFVFVLFVSANLNSSFAQKIISPIPREDSTGLLGKQDHSYSVVFRGNGEAVVSAKFILSNFDQDTPISEVELRVPKINPQDVIAFQVIKESQCIRFEPYTPQSAESSYISPRCLEYQEPDYFYDYSANKYQRAQSEVKGDTILVTLPTPIAKNKSGSFILYYSGFGYAKKNSFGAYNFEFESLKVNDQINSLTVGITTDSDLMLRGAKGKVDYRIEDSMMSEMKAVPAMGMAAPNSRFDSYYQQIGQGTITKKASSLQPLDSYTVKGMYADGFIKLYAKELLVFTLVLVIFAVLIIAGVKKLLAKTRNVQTEGKKAGNALMVIGASFASAFLTLIYTLALLLVSRLNLGYYGEVEMVLGIFLLIISIVFYILFILAPAIFIGIKKGFWAGVATLVLIVIWLLIFLFIIFVVLFLFRQPIYQPYQDIIYR